LLGECFVARRAFGRLAALAVFKAALGIEFVPLKEHFEHIVVGGDLVRRLGQGHAQGVLEELAVAIAH